MAKGAYSSSDLHACERLGKIPESAHAGARRYENLSLPPDDQERPCNSLRRRPRPLRREIRLRSVLVRVALPDNRACFAQRNSRKADQRAEFHQRLIRAPRIFAIQKAIRYLLHVRVRVVGETRDHAAYVSVNYCMWKPERDAGDRGGSVIADSGKFADRGVIARERALPHNGPAAFRRLRARE